MLLNKRKIGFSFGLLSLIFSVGIVYAATTIIPNGGTTWTQWGSGWSSYPGGYNGSNFQYTLNSQTYTVEYARWWTHMSGTCSAETYIPGSNNATRFAKYYWNAGSAYYFMAQIDQLNSLYWVTLSAQELCPNPSLYLYDNTGEPNGTTSVLYDDTRLIQ